jgi:hypothetical protein
MLQPVAEAPWIPHVYTDAIGAPREVPNEFKARNQITAGFE